MENLQNLIKGLDKTIKYDLHGYLTEWVERILNGKTLDAMDSLNVVGTLNDIWQSCCPAWMHLVCSEA
jgi:hypothetical protein